MTDAIALPDDTAALTQGTLMPLLGFGTWQIKGKNAVRATSAALEAGYRHLDTATIYGNEGEVGRALAESGVARDEVFLTTKCPPDRAGRELDTLRQSLDLLQTDHVDLWLIHWPGRGSTNVDLWRAFVEARESGLAREIGVSNFDAELIDEVTRVPVPLPRSTRSSGARCCTTPPWSPRTRLAASCWRATARCGVAPSTIPPSWRSRSGWAGPRRR